MQEDGCVMTKWTQLHLALVPATAMQTGVAQARKAWAAATAWTERMLTALEVGVKGGRWYSLSDKISDPKHLFFSSHRVLGNAGRPGVDHVTTEEFGARQMEEVKKLSEELRTGKYSHQAILRIRIPKPGTKETRPLGIPTVRDRVAQAAVRHMLEPIFEYEFAEHSYGFRPNRGCQQALSRVKELLANGYRYVVDADLKSYFDTIPHEKLLQLVSKKVADGRVIALLRSFLKAGILEDLKEWNPIMGAPQGAVISPLLSNIYLDPLDHLMADKGYEMIRYADDLVIMCRTQAEAEEALVLLQEWVAQAELTLHPEKTRIVNVEEKGFDFLGYHFYRQVRYVREKSRKKLKETIRQKTKRSNGRSLAAIIRDLNSMLRGWYGYFKDCSRSNMDAVDKYVRGRLRGILRKRQGKKGRGRGIDHQIWPNQFFADRGLFNLTAAHDKEGQPPRG